MINTTIEESLQKTAERELEKTAPGSWQEKAALSRLLKTCSDESQEQIVNSVYLRRKLEAKVAEKKATRRRS